jgi:hypothetical protein
MSDLYLQHLCQSFRRNHNCEAEHVETVPVVHRKKGKEVWRGNVEVFNLKGHPKAIRGYAWTVDQLKAMETTTVLKLPPVDSPKTAVRSTINED